MPENNERSLRQPELLRVRAYQRLVEAEALERRNPDGSEDSFRREETLLTAQDGFSPSTGFFLTARARTGGAEAPGAASPAPGVPPVPAGALGPAPAGGDAGRGADAGRGEVPGVPGPEAGGRAAPSGREPSGREAPEGDEPVPPPLLPSGREPAAPALPNGREPSGREPSGRDPSGREPSGDEPDGAPGPAPGAPVAPAPPAPAELPGRASPDGPPRRGFRLQPPPADAPPAERPNPGRPPDEGRPIPGPRAPPARGPPRGFARGPSGEERGPAPASRVRLPFFTASLICTSRPLMRLPVSVSMASCPSCGSRNSTMAKPRAFPSSSSATMISSTASPNGAK